MPSAVRKPTIRSGEQRAPRYQLYERLQVSRLMTSSSAENSLIAWSNSSVSWRKIGDNAFGATEAKKKGPGDAPLGQCKGPCCSEGSVPALLIS